MTTTIAICSSNPDPDSDPHFLIFLFENTEGGGPECPCITCLLGSPPPLHSHGKNDDHLSDGDRGKGS